MKLVSNSAGYAIETEPLKLWTLEKQLLFGGGGAVGKGGALFCLVSFEQCGRVSSKFRQPKWSESTVLFVFSAKRGCCPTISEATKPRGCKKSTKLSKRSYLEKLPLLEGTRRDFLLAQVDLTGVFTGCSKGRVPWLCFPHRIARALENSCAPVRFTS